ncbi:cytochrome b/b6 domain-containing protein [Acidisoma cellulosilytica]|uniref:Cytochrome b/b6 domain-containing protein n=1 Tax=Acidisoma cellulosilyticum TaxID=2802395 RepID=A0A963Z4A8_9PROT|nr:cytochrome b/b6 domain-containing protein [Acidisoma cellulosilyticum]MCB8882369.1 cytochrome b/b6 domain-containing protein [Acidisoma cellulosilyticum]
MSNAASRPARGRSVLVHPLIVRITHWVNAFAIVCMVMSGWQIYDASPLLPFAFPPFMTLGGWLGGAIAWHLAMMWLLIANGILYLGYGLASRHFKRSFFPLSARGVLSDFRSALHFNLSHTPGVYNAVQKLLYLAVLLLGILAFLSGLAMWKPVQFEWLAAALGSYPSLRWLHFIAMTGIVGFVIIHLALVIIVPRTLPSMITGRVRMDDKAGMRHEA